MTHAVETCRRATDLRLVLPAVLAWLVDGWIVGQGARTAVISAAVAAAFAGALAMRATMRIRRTGTLDGSRTRRWPAATLCGAVLLLTVGSAAVQLRSRESGPLPGWIRQRAVVELTAVVSADSQQLAQNRFGDSIRSAVRVRSRVLQGRGQQFSTSLPLLVLGGEGWSEIRAGQSVRLRGRLAPAGQGEEVVAVIAALGPPMEVRQGSWPWRIADRIRAGLRRACAGLPADAGGLLPALVDGDTKALPATLKADLRSSGLTHLTAVSGTNLAITVAGTVGLAALLGAGRRLRVVFAVLALLGFVVLARPQPSVLRAAAMAGVALTALAAGRRSQGGPALATAVIVLLTANPWLSRNAGFALSVAATAGLLWLAPLWADRLRRWMPRPLALAVAAPAAAQLMCGPVLILLAPTVSLVSVPANLLAEPAVAPATLLGVTAALLSPACPYVAHLVAMLGCVGTGWIAIVAHRAAALPFGSVPWLPGVAGAILLAAGSGVLIIASTGRAGAGASAMDQRPHPPVMERRGPLVAARPSQKPPAPGHQDQKPLVPRQERLPNPRGLRLPAEPRPGPSRERRTRGVVLLGSALLVLGAGWYLAPGLGRFGFQGTGLTGWTVAMCDVGQGDALAVRSGVDHAVMIDAGPDPGLVDRCLRRLGVKRVDTVLLTHFHADHALGLPGVLKGRQLGQVVVSPLAEPAAIVAAVRRWAGAARSPIRVGRAGLAGESGAGGWRVRWWVLAADARPDGAGAGAIDSPAGTAAGERARASPAAADDATVNDASQVILFQADGPSGSVRVLDLGDLEADAQSRLAPVLPAALQRMGGPVQVIKVAHHGSRSQQERVYRSCGARLGLIGVGAGNDYGHPAPATLGMLERAGILPERTDTGGDLLLQPSGGGLQVDLAGR